MKIDWTYIAALVSIAFGWALNEIGQWIRARKEDRRKLRQVLYNMLETYHLFLRSDMDEYMKVVTQKVVDKIPKEEQTPEIIQMIKETYSILIASNLKPQLIVDFKEAEVKYQQAIESLSCIDPLEAFWLSGKSSVLSRFESIDTDVSTSQILTPEVTAEFDHATKDIMDVLKPSIIKDVLGDLEHAIWKIAFKIGVITYLKSKAATRRMKQNRIRGISEWFDEKFDTVSKAMDSKPKQ